MAKWIVLSLVPGFKPGVISLVPLGFKTSSNDCIITEILKTNGDESIPFLLIHSTHSFLKKNKGENP